MSSLRVEHLSVTLGRRQVLDDVSFATAARGQVVGLFGANGAGKSTLMRCLVGLIGRCSGTITLPAGPVSYMPDRPYLYGFLRVSECLDLFASRYRDFSVARADDIVDRLGIDRTRRVNELSKGMSEQLHLALTFSRAASLYVLDEPLAAVDPYTRDVLLGIIQEVRGDGSVTVISTHIIDEVEQLFDEVVMISDGRLLLHDRVADVRARSGLSLQDTFKKEMTSR